MPLGYQGVNCSAHVHSQINMHTCAKFGPDRSSCVASFPHALLCDPLTPSKGERLIFLADVYSQMNLHTRVKFGPDRSSGLEAFPDLWIDDP